MTQSKWSSKI